MNRANNNKLKSRKEESFVTRLPHSVLNTQLSIKVSNILVRQNGLSHRIVYLISWQLTQASNEQFGYWGWRTKTNSQALKQTQAIKSLPSLGQPKLEPDPFIPQPFLSCWDSSPHSLPASSKPHPSKQGERTALEPSGNFAVRDSSPPGQIHKVVKPIKAHRAKQSPCTVNHRNLCGWHLINIHGQVLLLSLYTLK